MWPRLLTLPASETERSFRVRRVVQDADGECVVKHLFERQLEDVALHDVRVWQVASERERRLDARAEVDADNVLCSPFGGELCVATFAAAALEDDFALKEFGLYRLQPAEKLRVILRVFLRKVRPLPAKILRRLGLFLLDFPRDPRTAARRR